MPELPEVETIARALSPGLVGRVVAGLDVPDPKVLAGPRTRAAFARVVLGRAVTAVTRRAKLLLVHLGPHPEAPSGPGAVIAFHLKMTGRFHIAGPDAAPPDRARLLLRLDDGQALVFSDLRRFGTARAFASPEALAAWDFYATLGPEPWDMTPQAFAEALGRRGARIKAALLDQTLLAGVGNIYADESLFAAAVHPETPCRDLSLAKRAALLCAIQAVLDRAIAAGGSTIRDYRTPDGVEGGFQNEFTVYGRAGQACPACGQALASLKVAGRTSTFCPRCQKK